MANRKVAGRSVNPCRTRGRCDRYDYVLQLRFYNFNVQRWRSIFEVEFFHPMTTRSARYRNFRLNLSSRTVINRIISKYINYNKWESFRRGLKRIGSVKEKATDRAIHISHMSQDREAGCTGVMMQAHHIFTVRDIFIRQDPHSPYTMRV